VAIYSFESRNHLLISLLIRPKNLITRAYSSHNFFIFAKLKRRSPSPFLVTPSTNDPDDAEKSSSCDGQFCLPKIWQFFK
jgi:hypothetical protein